VCVVISVLSEFLDWCWESKRPGITGQCHNCGGSWTWTFQQTKCISGL